MPERSWVSHYIVPCPGNSICKHCKPGEPHPQQHTFSKLVHENNSPQVTSPLTEPPNIEYNRYLRKKKLMGASFGNLDPVPFDPEIDPEPYACFICWSLLHLTRHCQETATNLYCRNCGRIDVTVEECPRCARAYWKLQENRQQTDNEKRKFDVALHRAIKNLQEEDLDSTSDSQTIDFVKVSTLNGEGKLKCDYEENDCDEVQSDRKITSVNSYDECKGAGFKQEEYNNEYWSHDGSKKYQDIVAMSFTKDYENFTTAGRIECWRDSNENGFKNSTIKLESASLEKLKQENVSSSSTPLTSKFSDNCSDSYKSFHDTQNTNSNELFTFMRNKKMQDQLESDRVYCEAALNSFSGSESEYYFYDAEEENYDDYIIDEDKRSGSLFSKDCTIRFFLDLLDALKLLPIDIQTTVLLNFVSTHKKQGWQMAKEDS